VHFSTRMIFFVETQYKYNKNKIISFKEGRIQTPCAESIRASKGWRHQRGLLCSDLDH
jgi:hypothetical protein